MRIELRKFGEILTSRPAGREAALVVRSYMPPPIATEPFQLDFEGVKVLTPAWTDEFLSTLKSQFPNPIEFLASSNPSVIESLKILEE